MPDERNCAWQHVCKLCIFTGIGIFGEGFLRFADDVHALLDGAVDFANDRVEVRHQPQRPLITTRAQRCDAAGLGLQHRA